MINNSNYNCKLRVAQRSTCTIIAFVLYAGCCSYYYYYYYNYNYNNYYYYYYCY